MRIQRARQWIAGALTLGFVLVGYGQTPADPVQARQLRLVAGKSTIHTLPASYRRVSVGNPEVADVIPLEGREIYLLGKKAGTTNLSVWPASGAPQVIDLQVELDTSALQANFRQWMPSEQNLRVASSGDAIVLSGQLTDAARIKQAIDMVEQSTGSKKIINLLTSASVPQVLLEVKIAEVSKVISDRLGANVNARTGGPRPISLLADFLTGASGVVKAVSGGTSLSLDAERKRGLIKILAEPSILALSGQEGSFLAGGKIFIPVPQSSTTGTNAILLQEREYGVGLKFLPTVLAGGQIQLKVTPEVSELSVTGTTIKADGQVSSVLPTITTRRTSTTVQLQDGQSFAIGGLIKNNVNASVSEFPLLGEIPILGALFRSSEFQNDRSELVFVVTVHLVNPETRVIALPTDSYQPPGRFELMMEGKLEKTPSPAVPAPSSTTP